MINHFARLAKSPLPAALIIIGLASIVFAYLSYTYHQSGLTVEYFKGENFEQPIAREHVKNIYLNTYNSPYPGIPRDNFSARFYGDIKSSYNKEMNLKIESDDGVRLWVNDVLILDDWNKHPIKTNIVTVNLLKGYNKFVLEYFDNIGKAALYLEWKDIDENDYSRIPTKYFRKIR